MHTPLETTGRPFRLTVNELTPCERAGALWVAAHKQPTVYHVTHALGWLHLAATVTQPQVDNGVWAIIEHVRVRRHVERPEHTDGHADVP